MKWAKIVRWLFILATQILVDRLLVCMIKWCSPWTTWSRLDSRWNNSFSSFISISLAYYILSSNEQTWKYDIPVLYSIGDNENNDCFKACTGRPGKDVPPFPSDVCSVAEARSFMIDNSGVNTGVSFFSCIYSYLNLYTSKSFQCGCVSTLVWR